MWRSFNQSRSRIQQVVLVTDFGLEDGYVGVMRGLLTQAVDVPIVDLSHGIVPQCWESARFVLWAHYRYFPPGTLFLIVVDPEVGSKRKICVARAWHYLFIFPQSPILDWVRYELEQSGPVEIREVTHPQFMEKVRSKTFHGRDIFVPIAIALCREPSFFFQLGRRMEWPPLAFPFGKNEGVVTHVDHFGNLITTIWLEEDERMGMVRVGDQVIPLRSTYADVEVGELVAYRGSSGLLEIGVRNGNAMERLGVTIGESIFLNEDLEKKRK